MSLCEDEDNATILPSFEIAILLLLLLNGGPLLISCPIIFHKLLANL